MVHRCICSQYSSKAPHHPKKPPNRTGATAKPAAQAPPRGGRCLLTSQRWMVTPGGGAEQRAMVFRCLQMKFSNICAFPEGGEGT